MIYHKMLNFVGIGKIKFQSKIKDIIIKGILDYLNEYEQLINIYIRLYF